MKNDTLQQQKTHGTIVLGWDSGGRLVFAKTFDFGENNETEREQALEAFAYVSNNCHNRVIGSTESILDQAKFKNENEEEE